MTRGSQVVRVRMHLLLELRAGARAPGAPIVVNDLAQTLRISHTPVREALARLAGEGAVVATDDRGGFVVPRLGLRGYLELVDLTSVLLSYILAKRTVQGQDMPQPDASRDLLDPLAATEATIAWIVGDYDNGAIVRTVGSTGNILAPYRRVERDVVPGWLDDLERLRTGIVSGSAHKAFADYFEVRRNLAGDIVDAVERAPRSAIIFGI